MAQASIIRIRPFSLTDPADQDGSGQPHLSIEVDGRILPLTKFIEIKGEILASSAEETGEQQ